MTLNDQNTKLQNKRRVVKSGREKDQDAYKSSTIRIKPDFSMETLNARRTWMGVIQTLRHHRCPSKLLTQQNYPSQSMEEEKDSGLKPNLSNIYLPTQLYRRHEKENFNLKSLTTYKQTLVNNPSLVDEKKEVKPTT